MRPPEHRTGRARPRWCASTCWAARAVALGGAAATRRCATTPRGSTRGGRRPGCWSSTPPAGPGRPGPGGGPRARGRWTRTAPPACVTVPDHRRRPAGRTRCCSARPTASRTGPSATPPSCVAGRGPGRTGADLRTAGAALDALGAGLLTTAVAVLNWHDAAAVLRPRRLADPPEAAGWHRVCEAHGHEDYPRTDPAVICLVHDGADRVLLARQPVWPEGRFSVLAGFVEAGESLEACVPGRSTRRSASRSATSRTWAARPGRSRGRSWSGSGRSPTRTRRCARPRVRSPRRCG